jgi:hypothetical protein
VPLPCIPRTEMRSALLLQYVFHIFFPSFFFSHGQRKKKRKYKVRIFVTEFDAAIMAAGRVRLDNVAAGVRLSRSAPVHVEMDS